MGALYDPGYNVEIAERNSITYCKKIRTRRVENRRFNENHS